MVNLECFAAKDGKCSILTSKSCIRCKFFKTTAQAEADSVAALHRLHSLPRELRSAIAYTYYNGRLPGVPK